MGIVINHSLNVTVLSPYLEARKVPCIVLFARDNNAHFSLCLDNLRQNAWRIWSNKLEVLISYMRYLAKLDNSDIANRVNAEIVEMMPSGEVTTKNIAKKLYMSERSLSRKLKESGTSFRGFFLFLLVLY